MFWKRKKKDSNDYLKNELLRSRMSDISLRTDEIIQQYFFVAKEDILTLDEYLKIRELATKELGMVNSNAVAILGNHQHGKQDYLGIEDYTQFNTQMIKPKKDSARVQQECNGMEEPPTNVSTTSHFTQGNSMKNVQEHREVEKKTPVFESVKPVGEVVREVKEEDIELPFEDKNPSEACSEPVRVNNKKDNGFDFLAMLQAVED